MPAFPIVDSHVHFYDPSRVNYPWLASVPQIHRTYLPVDLDAERAGTRIESMGRCRS